MTIAAEQSFGPEHPSGMSPELRQGAVEQGSILSLGRDPHLLASRAGVLRTIQFWRAKVRTYPLIATGLPDDHC